jgi:putative endonuclease
MAVRSDGMAQALPCDGTALDRDEMPWPLRSRQRRGQTNYRSGAAAEGQVERAYLRSGHRLRDRRWRGGAGEIDLVMEKAGEIVFVEVKASRTHERAAAALGQGQIGRLLRSAEAYIGALPAGSLTPMRFDVALVDRAGRIDVIPNALGA